MPINYHAGCCAHRLPSPQLSLCLQVTFHYLRCSRPPGSLLKPLLSLTAISYLLALFPSSKGILPRRISSEQAHVSPLLGQSVRAEQQPTGELSRGRKRQHQPHLCPAALLVTISTEHWPGLIRTGYVTGGPIVIICGMHPICHEVGGSQKAPWDCVQATSSTNQPTPELLGSGGSGEPESQCGLIPHHGWHTVLEG